MESSSLEGVRPARMRWAGDCDAWGRQWNSVMAIVSKRPLYILRLELW